MRRSGRVRFGRATLGGVMLAVASAAATTHTARAQPTGAEAGDFGAATESHRARVVLVGGARDPELTTLLGELLGRQHVDVTVAQAERFEPDELFADRDGGTLRVFVALKGPLEARLYFRAPQGERYLVRRLALATGLDAVGRELVAQVVAASAQALLDATQGLSREEASAALVEETKPSPEPAPPSPAPSSAAPVNQSALPTALELRAAARYALQWAGSDFGVRHGPAVTGGLRWLDGSFLLGAELGAEYGFEQRFSTADVEGRRQQQQFDALLEAGVRLGRYGTVALGAGPRVELTTFRLEAKTATVAVDNPPHEARVGMRVELRYEWAFGHVSVGACALADIAVARTHYDLRDADGTASELASVSVFRPGAAAWLGVH